MPSSPPPVPVFKSHCTCTIFIIFLPALLSPFCTSFLTSRSCDNMPTAPCNFTYRYRQTDGWGGGLGWGGCGGGGGPVNMTVQIRYLVCTIFYRFVPAVPDIGARYKIGTVLVSASITGQYRLSGTGQYRFHTNI